MIGSATTRQRAVLLLVTATCALALTLGAWLSARRDAEVDARSRFDIRAAEIAIAVQGRMLDYEQVLRGAVGLFAASERVSREEWDAYVRTIAIERTYPGIKGVGYLAHVPAGQKQTFEQAMQRERVPEFRIFPPGERADYAPALYLAPLDESNRRAIGFDMYSEAARRSALEQARDGNAAVITGAVTLVQDVQEVQRAGIGIPRGFLMYLPVYRRGAPAETLAQRRAALAGFVFAPFRFRDLMASVAGAEPGVTVTLTDVTDPSQPVVLHEIIPEGLRERRTPPLFSRTDDFPVAKRLWRQETASLPALEAEIVSNRPSIALASGLAISALLLLIVWSLSTTRERAHELAEHMTVALRASEERLQLALASSHLALFDWDVATGLVHLSAEWSVMLGGEPLPTLVPIQQLQQLIHPEDAAAVGAQVEAMLSGLQNQYRVEHRVRRRDGGWKWIESSARVNERDAGGRALRVTGANADIEERKAVEQLKSEFIATVSHELRTPLTSMLGSLALLREGSAGELSADARKFVDMAYENSERLTALVNDILDMERIEAGRVDMELKDVDLAALLREAMDLNAAYAERHGVRFALEGGAAGLRVRADPERLMQVLTNLLSNAAKHSPRGADVTLWAEAAGGFVRIAVTDRGAGIAPAFLPRLFGKFEQADRAHGGTGLGLAISKALVERMRGSIGCDSVPGKGSTFWVDLPEAGPAAGQAG